MQKLVLLVALLIIPLPLSGLDDGKSFETALGDRTIVLSETGSGLILTVSENANRILTMSNLSFREVRLPGLWETGRRADRFYNLTEREDGFSFDASGQGAVDVTFVDGGFWFNVSSPHLVHASYSGCGYWYGGGSLLNQSFPLRDVDVKPLHDVISQVIPEALESLQPRIDGALTILYEKFFPLAMHLSPIPLAFMGLENDLMMTRPFGYNFQTPFWLSRGVGVFLNTTEPVEYSMVDGVLDLGVRGHSVRIMLGEDPLEVFDDYVGMVGKPSKVIPPDVVKAPIWTIGSQYSTDFDQEMVLDYARRIRDSGMEHSLMTIDVGWQKEHGDTDFDLSRFPDPGKMIEELHAMGFKVILWTVPYVSSTSSNYREGFEKGYFIKDPVTSLPLLIPWSYVSQIALDAMNLKLYTASRGLTRPLCSAIIDLSNPEAFDWYVGNLEHLVKNYGVDGFKMDQGEAAFLPAKGATFGNMTVNEYTDLCTKVGEGFDYYEIRSGWFSQSHGGWAREYDKFASWSEENGIKSVIPEALTLSILGYPYVLPDAVGGGQFFDNGYDEELYVRWAELAAFMPVMQFADDFFGQGERARVLASDYVKIHEGLYPYLSALAVKAAETGMPMVRPLFFQYPEEEECYLINDEYLLGPDILVAPVLDKGVSQRSVYLPAGLWKDYWSGDLYRGSRWMEYDSPLDVIPVFSRVTA